MPYVQTGGTDIYYESHGDGVPILFAHGAGGNAGIWFEQIAAFAPAYRCVAFDHRTFARSPADPASISPARFRDDALAVLDALGIDQAHLVAQSMGGWTCMRILLDNPDRVLSLTLSCTPGGMPIERLTDSMRNLTSADSSGAGVMATMSRSTMADPVRMRLYETINGFNTGFSMMYLRGLADPAAAIDLGALAAVNVPVLFISGAEDPLFPSEQLAALVPHFPDARIEVVSDAGHSPYFEQPAVFNRLLADFLEHGNSLEQGNG